MQILTKQQQLVYKHLKQSWYKRGSQPNLSELASVLNMNYVSLKQHLKALDQKGYLIFESQGTGKAPLIRLATSDLKEAA